MSELVRGDGNGQDLSPGRYRWTVCGLLFASTSLCYMDRQIFGLLKPILSADLSWSETDYGDIVAVFSLLYALGYVLAGSLVDRVGVRRGLSVAVGGWSIAAALHGFASSILGFKIARGALGLMEGGNFPASIKAVREWFPAEQRAFATGIFNAGSNVGAIITPLALPFIVAGLGWRAAFFIAGALGLVWLAAWQVFYEAPERQSRLGQAELAYIRKDDTEEVKPLPWLSLFGYRGTWAFALGMLLTSPVWWFYLNWIPGYLHDRYGMNMMQSVGPIVTIYLIADFGSVAGGWLSARFIQQGRAPIPARLAAMFVMALCTAPIALVSQMKGLWSAVLVIALASAGHQGFSANLYTLVSDSMPSSSVSSIVGIGGCAAGIAGMFVALAVGRILDATNGNYMILFVWAATAYLFAVLALALILRRSQGTPSSAITVG